MFGILLMLLRCSIFWIYKGDFFFLLKLAVTHNNLVDSGFVNSNETFVNDLFSLHALPEFRSF